MDTVNILVRFAFQLVFEGKCFNLKAGEVYALPRAIAEPLLTHGAQSNTKALPAPAGSRPADLSACYDDDATQKLPKIADPRSRPVNPYLDAAYQRTPAAASVPPTGSAGK